MPQLIEHIDAIARRLGRDVLFVSFPACDPLPFAGETADWETHAPRRQVVEWLEANGITWQACAKIADENTMLGYCGDIYLDVPSNLDDPVYQKLSAFLEKPDGTPARNGVIFYLLPLDVAMKNRHHDEPGFWDRWARDF